MSKFHNKITEVDNIKFDSKKESEKYQELKLLKAAGEVIDFELQPKFMLQEAFTHELTGYKHRAITYIADFRVRWRDGREEIIDSKGVKTDVFKLKAKLFDHKFPDLILVIE